MSDGADVVRWGFLGAGMVATKALAPAVHTAAGARLQAVASRSPRRAAALAPAGRVHARYEDLLADDDVDAVYVALANDAHAQWTLAALEAGKHVLCEKPLGLHAPEVRRMVDAARASGRLLVEAFWYRWHPRVREAERLVASGELGRVLEVDSGFCFDGSDTLHGSYRLHPDMGGGALLDVGCYAISGALAALGWPDRLDVETLQRTRHEHGVDLTTDAVLRADDARARVRGSFEAPEGQWLVVKGEAGTLDLPGPTYSAWTSDPTVLRVDGRPLASWEPVDAYRLMVEAFSARVRGEDAWVIPLEQSLRVAEVLDQVAGREQ